MLKFFILLVNIFFWVWLFIVPTAILGFLSFVVYKRSTDNLFFSIILLLIGVILGIALAEYIRKKYGLDIFFGKLLSTPELDDDNPRDNRKEDCNRS